MDIRLGNLLDDGRIMFSTYRSKLYIIAIIIKITINAIVRVSQLKSQFRVLVLFYIARQRLCYINTLLSTNATSPSLLSLNRAVLNVLLPRQLGIRKHKV